MREFIVDTPDCFFNTIGGDPWYFSVEDKEFVMTDEIYPKYGDDVDVRSLSDRYIELPYRESFEPEALRIFREGLDSDSLAYEKSIRGSGYYCKLRNCGLSDSLDKIRNELFREYISELEPLLGIKVVYSHF